MMLHNQPNQNGSRIPAELQGVRPAVLEEYVRGRVSQAYNVLISKLREHAHSLPGDAVPLDTVINTAQICLDSLPGPSALPNAVENMELQLVFRHDCLALGCLDPQCVLCQHNPHRRCNVNFDKKYLVSDQLKAKCGAIIRVELIDRTTGTVVEEELPDIRLEMNVLDGNMYDNKFLENMQQGEAAGEAQQAELALCSLMLNNRQQPLLVCTNGGTNDQAGRVILQLQKGKAPLPDLHVTDSSEALLSGRKPPFRLLVRAVSRQSGLQLNIRHAVSEGFVVATRRTRTAGKVDIPSVDDHVSKLEHMGKETVKKLQDLATAARQAGVEIDVPDLNRVEKVGEFKQLAMRAEQDGHLRQQLQHVLKLSKEKWDEARDHAMRAVVADNRMRAWYADRRSMDVGLLFTCRLGSVDLERPVGLLQRKVEGGETKIEATLMAQQTPTQRDVVRRLQPEAVHQWWVGAHPGWAIFPYDTEKFEQTGLLVVHPDGAPSSPPHKRARSPGITPHNPNLLLPPAEPGTLPAHPPIPLITPAIPSMPSHPMPSHPMSSHPISSTPFAAPPMAPLFPMGLIQRAPDPTGAPAGTGPGSRPSSSSMLNLLFTGPGQAPAAGAGAGGQPFSLSGLSIPSGLLNGGALPLPNSLDLDAHNIMDTDNVVSFPTHLFGGSLRLPSLELPDPLTIPPPGAPGNPAGPAPPAADGNLPSNGLDTLPSMEASLPEAAVQAATAQPAADGSGKGGVGGAAANGGSGEKPEAMPEG